MTTFFSKMENTDKKVKEFYDTIDFIRFIPPMLKKINIQSLVYTIEKYYDEKNPDLLPPEFEGCFFNFWDSSMFADYLKERYGFGIYEEVVVNTYIIPKCDIERR